MSSLTVDPIIFGLLLVGMAFMGFWITEVVGRVEKLEDRFTVKAMLEKTNT